MSELTEFKALLFAAIVLAATLGAIARFWGVLLAIVSTLAVLLLRRRIS